MIERLKQPLFGDAVPPISTWQGALARAFLLYAAAALLFLGMLGGLYDMVPALGFLIPVSMWAGHLLLVLAFFLLLDDKLGTRSAPRR